MVLALGVAACGAQPASEPPFSPAVSARPVVACSGLPAATCQEIADSVGSNADGVPPARVRITCVSTPACNAGRGEVAVEVVFADGSTTSSVQGWMAAGEVAPLPAEDAPDGPVTLPVAPFCLGLDAVTCRSMAESAIDGHADPRGDTDPDQIASIVVRCTGVCTRTTGEGTTQVRYRDGTTLESSFGYEGQVGG